MPKTLALDLTYNVSFFFFFKKQKKQAFMYSQYSSSINSATITEALLYYSIIAVWTLITADQSLLYFPNISGGNGWVTECEM